MSEVDRPRPGAVEERTAGGLGADGRKIRGIVPYGVKSQDQGGWDEVIEATAFRNTKFDELRATVDHVGVPLGRYPTTLEIEDRADGLHWALDPPASRQDVVEAVSRGDMRAGSWRMVVGREEWRGNTRHIHEIVELRDVCIAGARDPVYPAAAVELRTQQEPAQDGSAIEDNNDGAEERQKEDTVEAPEERSSEKRTNELRVEDRVEARPRRGLADEFRTAGFPGETATMDWNDYEVRAVTWTGSVDNVSPAPRRQAAGLGYDQRFCWPAFGRIAVDAGTTSVPVIQQTARSLATATNVVRAIDAVTNKPETGSTVTVANVPMKQVANVQSGIPNVLLETSAINTVIENDLRLAFNDGLDKIVNDTFAASGFQAPGTDNLVASVRKALTTLAAAGYNGDTLILTPAAAESLDLLVSGVSGGTADYVFTPGQAAPNIWTLSKRVSKVVAAPVVVDSQAYGKLYASPVSLARFEENAGKTNTSLVRLEGHAAFGVERQTAAIRIAAS
jgi:prohead serine protease